MSPLHDLDEAGGSALGKQRSDTVADSGPAEVLGRRLSAVPQSNQSPAIGQLLGQLMGSGSGGQQAEMISQMLALMGPAAVKALAVGALRQVLSPDATAVPPRQATTSLPPKAGQSTEHATEAKPPIADA